LPWDGFSNEVKINLEKTIVSFKQNLRVINKANNKTWQWVDEKGKLVKKLVKQTKGNNWAIRKPMHKETVSGIYDIKTPKGKIATSTRVSLSNITTDKIFDKITDESIKSIFKKHLEHYRNEKGVLNYDDAFDDVGIEKLNDNVIEYNNGKFHQPILKVKIFEVGSKFQIGLTGNNPSKYVEAAKGTNLFFSIYEDLDKKGNKKRVYVTVPFNEVIEHQKQLAHLPINEKTEVPIDNTKGDFLFSLSPNDLVYVPTDEELENPSSIDFNRLNNEQYNRIYKMVSSSTIQCFFIPMSVAISIHNKKEFSALNKQERDINGLMIKERCWKLKIDRLGKIQKLVT